MRQIIIVILLFTSLSCAGVEKKQPDIDLEKLEDFLSRLYTELKCPSYPLSKDLNLEICIHILSYNLDKELVLFAFTAYPKNNRFLQGFDKMSAEERKESFFLLLQAISRYTGVLPVREGPTKDQSLYIGKIQHTYMTHVYDKEVLRKNRVIHDFVRDNAVVGIRVIDGDMRYIAFLDLNRDMHYKEGDGVSILDFMTRPTDGKNEKAGTSAN